MSKLIILRHSKSVWNKKDVFTGWVDIPLSSNGIVEAIKAGEQLANINFDIVFTSLQIRAIETTLLALSQNKNDKNPVVMHNEGKKKEWISIYNEEMEKTIIPVYCEWHLNERYYGVLQGNNKAETAKEYGVKQVQQWRRSYENPPPNGESLKDTAERTIPFFEENILPQLKAGKNIFISAHGNSLRSIIMFIEKLKKEEILSLEIPTGKPLFYNFKNGQLEKASS